MEWYLTLSNLFLNNLMNSIAQLQRHSSGSHRCVKDFLALWDYYGSTRHGRVAAATLMMKWMILWIRCRWSLDSLYIDGATFSQRASLKLIWKREMAIGHYHSTHLRLNNDNVNQPRRLSQMLPSCSCILWNKSNWLIIMQKPTYV